MSFMYIVVIMNVIRLIFLVNWYVVEIWEIILNEFFGCKWEIYIKN